MNEKEIIKSKKYNIKKITLIIIGVGFVVGLIACSIGMRNPFYANRDINYILTSAIPYFMSFSFLPIAIIAIIFYFSLSKISLTVTNKRVYGTAIFGKRVDLPIDMISAAGTCLFKGIEVSTASGKIKFLMIKNAEEIHSTISKLLINRQNKETKSSNNFNRVEGSVADELKKYKELLDNGAISQEEYEQKKNELLNL